MLILFADEIDCHHARIGGRELEAEQGLGEDQLLRRAAEHLVDIAGRHLAGGRLIGLAAIAALAVLRFRLVEEGAGRRHIFSQPLGQKLVAQSAEILAPSHALGDGVEAIPGRRSHELEILLVLIGGAADHLIEPGAGMARIDAAEFLEGAEEMVVPRLAFRRHEAAHGKGVDQAVVKAEILVDVRSRNLTRFALRRGAC